MKTIIKYTFLITFLTIIGSIIYQNLDYLMTQNALSINIDKYNWHWSTPKLENLFYFGICFLAGLILSGLKGITVKWDSRRTIKSKENEIQTLRKQNKTLKTELDVFQHDPYIKKGLEKKLITQEAQLLEPIPEDPETQIENTVEEEIIETTN